MKLTLIDEATLETLPPLLYYDGRPKDEVPVAFRIFDPSGRYTFFATEGNVHARNVVGITQTFTGAQYLARRDALTLLDVELFGLAILFEVEYGYASLAELQSVRNALGLPLERDLYLFGNTDVTPASVGFTLADAEAYANRVHRWEP